MPRTSALPKYRLHRGSGQAFVQIKGRRYYLGKYDTPASKEAYARFVAELAVSPAPARSSINHFVAVVRRVFRWAASQELLPVAIYQALATVPSAEEGAYRRGGANAGPTGG